MRAAVVLLAVVSLHAQIENAGKPMRVPFTCDADDLRSAGLSCNEDEPCPIYLELTAVEAAGPRMYVIGNIHSATTTLASILLGTADNGKTWTEPYERLHFATLDQIQFFDFAHGWVSGEKVQPTPRDPFFLITDDGGKTWRWRPLFEDTRAGGIDRFWFDSPTSGALVLTAGGTHELYETMTGGDSWELRQTGAKQVALPRAHPPAENGWRLHADSHNHAYDLESRDASGWHRLASFAVELDRCK